MKILVANIGSTSLKWRLYEFAASVAATPRRSEVGATPSSRVSGVEATPAPCCDEASQPRLLHKGGFERVTDYPKAIEDCLTELKKANVIASESELSAVGFKTVIAKNVTGCVHIDERVLQAMTDFNGLAPAHNPPYITGIKLFAQRMPGVPLIALFETAFHQFAPEASQRYAVPQAWLDIGIRRWGFHGASHKFIAERSAELLCRPDVAEHARQLYVSNDKSFQPADLGCGGRPTAALRVISCHLGGSSSVTGILNGASIGTSMGLSPQSGLPQNNRVGDLDAEALPYAVKMLGISVEEAQRQLTKEGGLKGLSGLSNDIRDIGEAAAKGDVKAKLALDAFVASTRHWIGSFFLQLNGVDAIVFTAGIGENRADLRAAICANLENLGIKLDAEKNAATKANEAVISAADSLVKIFVIPTNEELVVARETKRFLEANK